nr:hypothetical protein [uncultured Acetobacterium sp.]
MGGRLSNAGKNHAYEKSADGMRIDEAVKIAKMLEENGCNAIEVSSGIVEDGFCVCPRRVSLAAW